MPRVPMIFPGQASQAVGMARDLAGAGGPAADWLARVDELLGTELTPLMYEGPLERLTETWNAQPAILAHSVAVLRELQARGIEPALVAGHSLGEYSAAVAAGALDAADALRLVRRRGELMFAAGQERPGTMAAVIGLDAPAVERVCRETEAAGHGIVVMANHNSAAQIAISGERAAVEAAMAALKEAGARRVIPLNVSGAFHSPLLEEAAATFAGELDAVAVADPAVPLVANVTAAPVTTAEALKDGLRRQLTAPVRWHDSMARVAAAARDGDPAGVVLEVGPGRVLTNLARREFPDVTFVPVGTVADLEKVLDTLGGGTA